MALPEAQARAALKLPLVLSVGYISIVLVSALSGLQPHAYTCDDSMWQALLVIFVLVAVALVTGVMMILYERQKRRRGNKFWNSLLSLAAVLLVATVVGILELLDHVLRRPNDCWPLDDVAGAVVAGQREGEASPVVRGLLHLCGRTLIYTLPSISLLSLFRSHRRQRSVRQGVGDDGGILNSRGRGVAPTALSGAETAHVQHLSPLPSLLRPWRQTTLSSMTEALLRAPPSVQSLSDAEGAGDGGSLAAPAGVV